MDPVLSRDAATGGLASSNGPPSPPTIRRRFFFQKLDSGLAPAGHYQAPEAERSIPNGGSNCDYLGCRRDHRRLCGDAALIHHHLDRALVLVGWLANQSTQSRIQMVELKH
jgi:hypothetical protein